MDFATARKRVGMTQTMVADALNVSDGTVAAWENYGVEPRPQLIPKIAEVFKITPDQVLEMIQEGKKK